MFHGCLSFWLIRPTFSGYPDWYGAGSAHRDLRGKAIQARMPPKAVATAGQAHVAAEEIARNAFHNVMFCAEPLCRRQATAAR
jgi:hypothetical protein